MNIKPSVGKIVNGANQGSASPGSSLGLGALVLLPGIIAGFILYMQRLPFPYQDDFKALLAFASQYKRAPGFSAKALQIAVFPYGSYRLIFEHGVIAAQIGLTHHLNFGFFTALGDLFLLGIFGLLWCSFERTPFRSKLLYFLPVSLMFFSLSYWETLNWAMASLQNVPVIFFALLSLYLLGQKNTSDLQKGKFLLSCIAALLACCSSPNGFLLAPVGVLMLASQRRFKHTFVWLLSFILPLSDYLYHPILEPAQHGSYLRKLFYFIAFFGGALSWHPVAFVAGVALLLVLLWAVRAHVAQQNPVLFFFALWIVLSDALIETVRTAIASRYSIYSLLIVVCCYDFVLRGLDQESLPRKPWALAHIKRRRFLQVAIASSLCFYLATAVWAYRHLAARRQMVLAGFRFYRANPLINSPQMNPGIDILYPDEKPFELWMLNRAAQDDLYTVPPTRDLQP
jgi:hypothetical protein